VFAHRPARQPHAKAVVVYEQSCDGAERVSDERAEQGRSRPTGSDPGCPRRHYFQVFSKNLFEKAKTLIS
jgi:hypothetical protein